MRHAQRRDASHKPIAAALRAVGAKVLEGFDCDLYVSYRGSAWLMECKTAELTQRKRKPGLRKGALRDKQVSLQEIFGMQYVVVFTVDGALMAIGAIPTPRSMLHPKEWSVTTGVMDER